MSAHLLRRLSASAPIWLVKLLGNLWLPFWGAGICVSVVDRDYRYFKVILKRRFFNRNYVGTHFGGSIYAMTDPFFMLMLINNLGGQYIVWDKSASIRFRRPGKTDLYAEFRITQEDIERIQQSLKSQMKMDWERSVNVYSVKGELVAEVHKVLQISKRV